MRQKSWLHEDLICYELYVQQATSGFRRIRWRGGRHSKIIHSNHRICAVFRLGLTDTVNNRIYNIRICQGPVASAGWAHSREVRKQPARKRSGYIRPGRRAPVKVRETRQQPERYDPGYTRSGQKEPVKLGIRYITGYRRRGHVSG
jgi:hypothetical protein